MAFLKSLPFRERFKFQFRAEFFNIYNHLNLGDPATALTSVTFGAVRSANDPRISHLALKFFFLSTNAGPKNLEYSDRRKSYPL